VKSIRKIIIEPTQLEQVPETDAFSFVFVRDDIHWHKIAWRDILYLKSDEHFVHIVTDNMKFTIATSLTACEKNLPLALFRRVHRSYIVNISKIDKLNKTEIIIKDKAIPLTRTFADTIFKDFVWARLLG
jgi:two-component system, LytTR family, response regulator